MAGAHFPPITGTPVVIPHNGRADQEIIVDAWPTTGFWGHEAETRAMKVAMQIIQTRLFDKLRETDGATYSPSADTDFSDDFADYGVASIRVSTSPPKAAAFEAQVKDVIDDLVMREVTQDELIRAKQPLIEQRLRDLQTNNYWLSALVGYVRDPRALQLIRDHVTSVQAVTAADVQRVCTKYINRQPYELIVRK